MGLLAIGAYVSLILAFVYSWWLSYGLIAVTPLDTSDFTSVVQQFSRPGDLIMVVDANGAPGYPGLAEINRGQASRYLFPYPIPYDLCGKDLTSVYDEGYQPPASIQQYFADFKSDIDKYHPPMIFIRIQQETICPVGFRLYDFLQAQHVIDQAIDPGYKLWGDVAGLRTYVLRSAQS
jgi:hypothetical protein